ncbi:MAG TPA: hypothetical protein VGK32_06900 [Vicinamibacterales bacterium]
MAYYLAVQNSDSIPPGADAATIAEPSPAWWQRAEFLVPALLVALVLSFVLTVDPVANGYGLKGDEATYTAMALSAAYDRDLAFERQDLERYWAVYRCGPDGIFLKRGKLARIKFVWGPPFIRRIVWGDGPVDHLYFGKAYIYPLMASPFVWLFGLRGMLVFHALLLTGVGLCGYRFVRARSARAPAMIFTTAFLVATVVPVFGVWMTAEVFNFSLAFFAYFLWLYKEVSPVPAGAGRVSRWVRGPWSDVLAAVLLGMMTFSKPLYALLIVPVVLWPWVRRRFVHGLLVGIVFCAVLAGLFGFNSYVSGEWNYQGGNRKVFYTWFPTQRPEMTFDTVGYSNSTNELYADAVYDSRFYVRRFAANVGYFLVGRHSGLVPFFFPGVAAFGLWLWRFRQIRGWQILLVLALLASVATILVILPYTWSGGGGPPGNRYFMGLYPLMFFLLPALDSALLPLIMWMVGAVFTAQLVLNPYFTARFPYQNLNHGAVRFLPIELTMVNDLPIMLDRFRSRLPYGNDPQLSLYLLDENVYDPEPAGIWFSGGRRGDVIVRTTEPIASMRITVSSPIPNRVWLSFDGRGRTIDLKPDEAIDMTVDTRGRGVYSNHGFGFVLSVEADRGFVPKLRDSTTNDRRFLGAMLRLQATAEKKK